MTADQRLDQLEPLVSQTLAVADRHTAQLKQIYGAVNQLLEAGQMQSDNTQFVLRELGELRQDVRADLGELRQEVRKDLDELRHQTTGIQQNQSLTSTRIGDLENAISLMGNQVTGLDAKVTGLDAKLDQLLELLDGNK